MVRLTLRVLVHASRSNTEIDCYQGPDSNPSLVNVYFHFVSIEEDGELLAVEYSRQGGAQTTIASK
jgi:hypothetical protein